MRIIPLLAVGAILALAFTPIRGDDVYVYDYATFTINKVALDGTVSPAFQNVAIPHTTVDLTIGPDGTIFTLGSEYFNFNHHDFAGKIAPDGTGTSFYANATGGGVLTIANDLFGNAVFRIRPTSFSPYDVFERWDAGTHTVAEFGYKPTHTGTDFSADSKFDGSGNFYSLAFGGITKTTPGGVSSGVYHDPDNGLAQNLAVDLDGNVYADIMLPYGAGRNLYKIGQDGSKSLLAEGVFGSLATDTAGNIFVDQAGTLMEVTPSGVVNTLATGVPGKVLTIVPEPSNCLLLMMSSALIFGRFRPSRKFLR
jgi:hypothetical protein